MQGSAVLSADRRYRYQLTRRWAAGPTLVAVLLNPGSADAASDDPTVRRCLGFARAAGCAALHLVNLYAWRSSDPRALGQADDPVGPDNDAWLTRTVAGRDVAAVVAGWGARAAADRVAAVLELCAGRPLHCLGRTRDGQPRHPLYLPGGTPLVPYPG